MNMTVSLKMTWPLLLKAGVRKVAAWELLWNSGKMVIWFRGKVVAPDMDGVASHIPGELRWVVDVCGQGRGQLCMFCGFPRGSVQPGVIFCIHNCFLQMKSCKSKCKIPLYSHFPCIINGFRIILYSWNKHYSRTWLYLIRLRFLFTLFEIKRKHIYSETLAWKFCYAENS